MNISKADRSAYAAALELSNVMAAYWKELLGKNLLGFYLLGSLAHGGFNRRYSDIDLGLVAEIRRAAVSIPSNISEGAARNSDKDYIRFLYISLGSLSEIETQLIIAEELGFSDTTGELMDKVEILRPKLLNLIKYLKTKDS